MCSVIGVYSKKNEDVSQQLFQLMSGLMHRGPDAFGIKTASSEKKSKNFHLLNPFPKADFALGHCLLSTTGYGVQPLTENGVSIAHNGQIYNYNELNSAGRDLVSDSEAISVFLAHGISRGKSFGEAVKDFMVKANGEYAVGAFHNDVLYAFRDPIGLKPLWFGENDSIIAFASEPQALMKVDIQFPQPLSPGHLLEVSKKGFSLKKILGMEDFIKPVPKKYSINDLKTAFDKTVSLQTSKVKKAAVLFSGGVDSSLIAKAVSEKVKKTVLFVAGVEGSNDLVFAKKAAGELGLDLNAVELSEKRVSSLCFRSMKILSFFDEMQLGIAVPELACSDAIAKDGFRVVFSGQGSDELFCGYSSYAKTIEEKGFEGVEDEIWFSLSRMWSRNFHRDDAIIARNSLELRVPFVCRDFIMSAMAVPAKEKIRSANDSLRKHPLRELARLHGIPNSICERPKRAMQYGSGSQKLVSKLFKRLGS